ncbi:MAG: ABC transporter ATP-binding protein [Rickettsiaceae bacterium]|nr:ABC transporter ATP-binding protein [Rickettsiaceae bacterium]
MSQPIIAGVPTLPQTLGKCIYFLFRKQKLQVSLLVLLIILIGIAPSIDSLFLQNITDQIEYYSDEEMGRINLASVLFKWVIIYALWWEALNGLWRLYDYAYLKIMPKIKAQVIDEFFNYIQYHDHAFFQNTLAGDISNRITEAARSLEMAFAYANERIIHKLAMLLFAFVTLYTVHQTIAFIFLTWIVTFVGMSVYFSNTINSYSSAYGKDKTIVAGKIVDSIANISVIRMFSSFKHESKNLNTYLNKAIKSDQKMQWFMFKLRYALGTSCTIMIAAMIYYIATLRGNLEISTGQCVLIVTLCVSVIGDVWDLTQSFGELFEQMGAFNQSLSLLQKYRLTDIKNPGDMVVSNPSIEFKNVTFTYSGNSNSFSNKSIRIEAYEKIGLIGFSGSGKTTFVNMISRLYDIDQGQILIDGQDIQKVTQSSLRKNISIIPQEPILFHRTVLENIRYGNMNASDEEIFEAAKNAHIHDVILNLPEGYNTICGERGNNFSGGQRQRIIIARAFLKNAPILILDEATSSLDSHTEYLIQESLHKLMQDKTVLIIAHRLSTLVHMDRILVFNKGHVVEDGTHENLREDGAIYKMLWDHC